MDVVLTVVGAVIVRDGRVLCAKRGEGGNIPGLWEFPGGKVEPGERPRTALAREIEEELGCRVAVDDRVTSTLHVDGRTTIDLTTYWCRIVEGEPTPLEHDEIAWLAAEALGTLEWAPADLPAVGLVRDLLRG